MTKRRRLDKSEITEPSSAFDLFYNSIRKRLDFDIFDSGVTRFNAIVLTQPILLSPGTIPRITWLDAIGIGADSLSLGKFKFFARIIGLNSPHSFLPDPCDPAIASDPAKQLEFIKLHTEFYSTKDSSVMRPKVGDTIVVELQQNAFSYNLYVGEYVKLLDSTAGNAAALQDCSGLASNFVNVPPGAPWTPPPGGGPAPPTRGGPTSPAGTGPSSQERNAAIDAWWPLIKDYLPSWAKITSRGRTVMQGRAMIYRFANTRGIPNTGDLNDPTEVERVRKILVRGGLDIAPPEGSNHCTGAGCRGPRTRVAFDIGGTRGSPGQTRRQRIAQRKAQLVEIAKGLRKFKLDTGPTGYAALLANGTLPGPFITTGFVGPRATSYNAGGGWRIEFGNKAVHLEFTWTPPSP